MSTRDYSKNLLCIVFTMHSEVQGTGGSYFDPADMLRDILFVRGRIKNWHDSNDEVEISFKKICEIVLSRFEALYFDVMGEIE